MRKYYLTNFNNLYFDEKNELHEYFDNLCSNIIFNARVVEDKDQFVKWIVESYNTTLDSCIFYDSKYYYRCNLGNLWIVKNVSQLKFEFFLGGTVKYKIQR